MGDLYIRAWIFIRAFPEADGLAVHRRERRVAGPSHGSVRRFLWFAWDGPPIAQILSVNQRQFCGLAVRVMENVAADADVLLNLEGRCLEKVK